MTVRPSCFCASVEPARVSADKEHMRSVVAAVMVVALSGLGWPPPAAAGSQSPAAALDAVQVTQTTEGVVILLRAPSAMDGTLQRIDAPPRVFVDLATVRPGAERRVPVQRGGVRQVRIALNREAPPLTRVVVDLDAPLAARLERAADGRELRIVIGTGGPPAAVTAPTRRTTSTPHAAYVAWFTPAAARITRLLDDMVEASGRGAAAMEPILAEWMLVEKDLAGVRTPPAAENAHALLVEAARLGRIAAARRAQGSAASAEAIAGESGARLLLDRARAALDGLSPQGP